ncbi:hypothetical protein V2J09_023153 [Rumex salicifolius]
MDNLWGSIEPSSQTSPSASTARATGSPQPVTTSTSCTDTINDSHEFKVTGYSLSKGLGIGKYIASDTFHVGGFSWAIYFYPDGKNPEDDANYVSVFIALAGEGADVRALFELTLVDQSGNENHKVHSHFGRTMESGPYTLKYRGSMGYKRFFKRVALETSGYLKDDCLVIRGVVGIVKSHTEGPMSYNIPIPPSDMSLQFAELLESNKGTDVTFEVGEEVFSAHKLVLAARSPVFKAQLFGPMKERSFQCLQVEDMEAPVFKALLHFIYWDDLPDLQDFAGLNSKGAFTIMAQHLLAAADRYGLERLRLLCEAILCEDVAINTVATTLALADQHHCFQLKAVCLKFIASRENLRAVMQTEGFEYLNESFPSVLTELLECIAKTNQHSVPLLGYGEETVFDGTDGNGRRVVFSVRSGNGPVQRLLSKLGLSIQALDYRNMFAGRHRLGTLTGFGKGERHVLDSVPVMCCSNFPGHVLLGPGLKSSSGSIYYYYIFLSPFVFTSRVSFWVCKAGSWILSWHAWVPYHSPLLVKNLGCGYSATVVVSSHQRSNNFPGPCCRSCNYEEKKRHQNLYDHWQE